MPRKPLRKPDKYTWDYNLFQTRDFRKPKTDKIIYGVFRKKGVRPMVDHTTVWVTKSEKIIVWREHS